MSVPIPPRRPARRAGFAPTPISMPTPVTIGVPTPLSSAAPASLNSAQPSSAKPSKQRTCPDCKGTEVEDYNGQTTCLNCGTVIAESNIVTEVTFGENAAGGAVLQGGMVSDGQQYARPTGKAFRRMGGGGAESRELSLRNGRDAITALADSLHVPHAIDPAVGMYSLAHANGFVQGRPTQTVAAVCLYVACRRLSGNTLLLIDLAEKIQINVYFLGRVYKALIDALYLNYHDAGVASVVEVEPLLLKYAQRLEFGDKTNAVAADAARILSRMDRDWIVTGRTPNGLCGACLILAARMNNFRRSIREVVFVVKTSDTTVLHRLSEFKRTTAGQLTVDDFRKFAKRLKKSHDPPSLYLAEERAQRVERIRRKRKMALEGRSEKDVKEGLEYADVSGSRTSSVSAACSPRDSEMSSAPMTPAVVNGKVIDAPADIVASLMDEEGLAPLPKGRKRKRPVVTGIKVTEEDLAAEEILEDEIMALLDYSIPDDVFAVIESRAKARAEEQRGQSTVLDTPDIGETEFDDDPEVANCLLSPEEIQVKEKLWVTMNADWLRDQQLRQIQKEKAELLDSVRPTRKKRKFTRLGDGSLLRESGPVSSAAEATARMLEKRLGHNASKKVNYDLLRKAYGGTMEDMNGSLERLEKQREEKRQRDAEKRKTKRDSSVLPDLADDDDLAPRPDGDEMEDGIDGAGPAVLPTPPTTQPTASQQKPKLVSQAGKGGSDGDDDDGDGELEVVEEFDEDDDDGGAPSKAPARASGADEDDDEDVEEYDEDDDDGLGGYVDYADPTTEEPAWDDLGYEWEG